MRYQNQPRFISFTRSATIAPLTKDLRSTPIEAQTNCVNLGN
jgi:hypothetical protein